MEAHSQKQTFHFIHKDLFSWLVAFPLFYLGAIVSAIMMIVMVANGNLVISKLGVMMGGLLMGLLGYKLLEASITVDHLSGVSIEITKKRLRVSYSSRSYPAPGPNGSWQKFELKTFVPYVVVGAGMRPVPRMYRMKDQWHLYGTTSRGKKILLAKFSERDEGLLWEKYFSEKIGIRS